MLLSVVIPVYNEQASLAELHQELDRVAAVQGYAIEMIFVDDGSTDGSWETICRLAAADYRVRGIRFRRNFGKAAALSAGFTDARGELLITLDADLQDDPAEIPCFLAEMEKGLDIVSGWKKVRYDPWHRVLASRVFNRLVGWLTGVRLHDHNCGMKCYRREVSDDVVLYGELHRFVPVLAAARGYRVGEVVIRHRPRKFGRSKYGVSRFLKGFLDLLTVTFLTRFGERPQHALGAIGLVMFLLGAAGAGYLALCWFISRLAPGLDLVPIPLGPAVVGAAALVVLGGQLLATGLLAELCLAYRRHRAASYSVSARTGPSQGPSDRPFPCDPLSAEPDV